jgi:hypothetical protein
LLHSVLTRSPSLLHYAPCPSHPVDIDRSLSVGLRQGRCWRCSLRKAALEGAREDLVRGVSATSYETSIPETYADEPPSGRGIVRALRRSRVRRLDRSLLFHLYPPLFMLTALSIDWLYHRCSPSEAKAASLRTSLPSTGRLSLDLRQLFLSCHLSTRQH